MRAGDKILHVMVQTNQAGPSNGRSHSGGLDPAAASPNDMAAAAAVLAAAAGGVLGSDAGGVLQKLQNALGVDELGVRQGSIGGDNAPTPTSRFAGACFTSGSAGTMSAGDYLKEQYPYSKLAVGEALQEVA